MRVKPYKPRGAITIPHPKTGEYWLVEYNGKHAIMKVSEVLDLTWLRCGDDFPILSGVKPLRRINLK